MDIETGKIKEYYLSHFRKMVLVARQYVGDIDLAQDLVQDVFAYLLAKGVREIDNPDAYFYTAIKRKCLDHLKTQAIRSAHHDEIVKQSAPSFFEDTMEKVELESHMMELIDTLPERCREVFKASRFAGQSNDAIAATMNISKRTVETQISHALKKIRAGLDDFKAMVFSFL